MIMTILFWLIIAGAAVFLILQQWEYYKRWRWARRIEQRMRRYARSRKPF